MSMNKYMHPRNIYKNRPDFKELALQFPEFKKHVKIDVTGKIEFDFKDPEALRALSCTLLKKDFNLDVEFPKNKLIPTVPLRLNYILWIEDLLSFLSCSDNVKGVDIGTGASCVYPLMAARKNHWSMLATEADEESYQYAQMNVQKNNLNNLINVVKISGNNLLIGILNPEEDYAFCMCNPPFFSNTQELHPFFKSRKLNRPHPKNAFVATVNEVVAKGGEVEFIQKLINESKQLKTKIKVYTTMIGQKSHLPCLKKSLREAEVHSFKEAEFCQGNTTRWGLAWTYVNYDLRKVPDETKLAHKSLKFTPLLYELSELENSPENVGKLSDIIQQMFKELMMTVEEVSRNKKHQRYFVTAYSNTWSNQRRKRREKLRKTSEKGESLVVENNNLESLELESTEVLNSTAKRTLDDICQSTSKKLRLSTDSDSSGISTVFYKFMFGINCETNNIILELNTVDGFCNRDYLHQILQYIKNNFNRIVNSV